MRLSLRRRLFLALTALAVLNARTLSDEDLDEVFAWLEGEAGRAPRHERPGWITRTARRHLVLVASLPATTVEAQSADVTLPYP
jgi:hypothetical protein